MNSSNQLNQPTAGFQVLNRKELKNLVGGVAGDPGWVNCKWTYTNGDVANVPCSYSAESCQDDADAECLKNDLCTDVDCR